MRVRALLVAVAAAALPACSHAPSAKEKERAEIHYNLGAEALRQSRFQDALKEFDEALAADGNFADAHLGRGLVMEFGFGKLDEAESHYRRALELRPGYSEAHNNLGQLLARRGRLDEAVKHFDLALENMLYKEPFIARCNKGEALHRLGRSDDGVAELTTCLKLNPRYCLGHRMLGLVHLEGGRAKLALDSFGRYAQSCPQSADAWYQVGLASLKTGDAAKAGEAFEKCEGLAPQSEIGNECRRTREMLQ